LLALIIVMVLASVVLLAQGSARGSGSDCPDGAISAIGPVDAKGRGDTTADIICLQP